MNKQQKSHLSTIRDVHVVYERAVTRESSVEAARAVRVVVYFPCGEICIPAVEPPATVPSLIRVRVLRNWTRTDGNIVKGLF